MMSIGGLVPWTDVINGAAGRRCIGTLVLAPLQRSYTRTLLQDPTPSEELPSISMRAKEPWRAVLVSACMCLGESLLGPVIEDMLAWAWDCYSERSLWGAALSAGLMGACLLGPLDSVRTRMLAGTQSRHESRTDRESPPKSMITKRSSGLLTIAQNAGAHALAKTASLLTIEAISFALDLRLYSSGTSPRLSTHWKVLLVFLAGLVAESLVAAPTDLLRARKAMEVSTGLLSTVSAGARASPFGLLGGVLAMWKGWRLCFLLKLGIWIIDESFSFILTSVSVPLRVAY